MHLLLVVLLASLVHLSTSEPPKPFEMHTKFEGGFPVGSLLTVYLKSEDQPGVAPTVANRQIEFKLCGDFQPSSTGCLWHYVNGENNYITDVMISGEINENRASKPGTGSIPPHALPEKAEDDIWWRFDIYRISETEFLPFFKGFEGAVRTIDVSGIDFNKLLIRSVGWSTMPPLKKANYDMDDVYVTLKHPETSSCSNPVNCKPGMVIQALDKAAYDASRINGVQSPLTDFLSLPNGFPKGKKIRLTALLVQKKSYYDKNKKNWASIYFFNKAGNWAFGIFNRWNNDKGFVELDLFAGEPCKEGSPGCMWNWRSIGDNAKCHGTGTSSDIVHVKLERLHGPKIRMRTYYMNGKAGGITCEKMIDSHKDNPFLLNFELKVQGDHMARLLHFEMV